MLEKIKKRCGIAEGVKVYNEDISDYIEDALEDMKTSGVPPDILKKDTDDPRVLTAVTLYVKAYLYHNMKDYDKAIEFYKKTIEVDPNYAEAYSNLGLIYCLQAQDFSEKATTDVNDPKYKEDQATLKVFYEKARPNYEKARELKPDQKDLWLNGLYRVYYNLQMGPEFDEIDKMMQ